MQLFNMDVCYDTMTSSAVPSRVPEMNSSLCQVVDQYK